MRLTALLWLGALTPTLGNVLPEKRAGPFSQVRVGNYRIANCGDNNALMESLIRELWKALPPVVQDAKRETASPAFSTFFNDIAFAPYVSALLANVSTGVAMDKQGSPVFFCTTAPGQIKYIDKDTGEPGDVYARCRKDPSTAMTIMHSTPYIIVCPSFFHPRLEKLPPPNRCPQTNKLKTKFRGSGASIIEYQMWILLEEIAHYYIWMTTGAELDIYPINTCATMDGKQSSQNPHNYLFYAASIYGRCTEFPHKPSGDKHEF